MRHYAKLLRATLTASLMLVALAGAADAGPLEDASAAYHHGDYATALRLFRPLADQGFPGAQYNLGVMYQQGKGVPQDYSEAAKWFRLAADQGVPSAQANLGFLYKQGTGVPQDFSEALKWWRKAADQGEAVAELNLGLMYADGQGVPQDYVQAHMWLNLAASQFPSSEKENREIAVKNRDLIASKMTPAQIAEAQKLAREWTPKSGTPTGWWQRVLGFFR